jgi:hypothetical protein
MEWSASRSGNRGKSLQYLLDKRLSGPQSRSEQKNLLTPAANTIQVAQCVARRYTETAINCLKLLHERISKSTDENYNTVTCISDYRRGSDW